MQATMVLIVCLATVPDRCKRIQPAIEPVPFQTCMAHGQQIALPWLHEHPKWTLRGWQGQIGARSRGA